jgi:outer membrane receptor for monomeric catechols
MVIDGRLSRGIVVPGLTFSLIGESIAPAWNVVTQFAQFGSHLVKITSSSQHDCNQIFQVDSTNSFIDFIAVIRLLMTGTRASHFLTAA